MASTQARGEFRLQLCLFCGVLLLFLIIWKGDGGYLDLVQYLDNTEDMWLKGDLSIPGKPGRYYIHPLGISFLSGPFVLAGAVIEKITGGAIGHRAVAAFSIPVFSALACLFLYKTGRELSLTPAVSTWGALMLALGSPLFMFTRFYFAEGGIALSICLACWAYLCSKRSDNRAALYWALLAGAGLAGATACHFNNLLVSAGLWIGMAFSFLADRKRTMNARLSLVAALTAIPVIAGAALLIMNARRFGGPFMTGYEGELKKLSASPISLSNIQENIQFLVRWLLRVPWAIPAFYFFHKLRPRQNGLAAGLALATFGNLMMFQMFTALWLFPIRYQQSNVILLSVGLMLMGAALWERWKWRGLLYSAIPLIFFNLGYFIRFDSAIPSFLLTPDGEILCYVWYMTPVAEIAQRTAMGSLQWTVFTALAVSGLAVLGVCLFDVYRLSSPEGGNPATSS